MTDLNKLRSYADIRKYADAAAFTQAMSFIAWHNRLTYTPMLEPWEALVVTLLCESKALDPIYYTALKGMLEKRRGEPVLNLEQANARATELLSGLS